MNNKYIAIAIALIILASIASGIFDGFNVIEVGTTALNTLPVFGNVDIRPYNLTANSIGINLDSPNASLHVNGSMQLAGNITWAGWNISSNVTDILFERGSYKMSLDENGTLRISGDIITNDASI